MKEKLQKKLEQLYKEREQAQVAILNYNGAIAVVQQLLQEEEAKESQTPAQQQVITRAELPKSTKTPKVITVVPENAN